MRTGHALALFSFATAAIASCADIDHDDPQAEKGGLAQLDPCSLNPGSCDGTLAPTDRFQKNVGRPSRVHGLWFGEDERQINGAYYVPSIDSDVTFNITKYGSGDWDLTLAYKGQSFLSASKYAGQPEAIAHHQLAELPLSDAATDELMLSVAEFFPKLSERYPDALLDLQFRGLPKCEIELELEFAACPRDAGHGPIFGGKCRVYVKVKAKIKCKP